MLRGLEKSYAREETSQRQDSSEKTSQGSSTPRARLLQNNRHASLPGFPKGSVSSRSSTNGLPGTSSWQSPLGSQQWLISKRKILLEEAPRSKQEVTSISWNRHPMGQENFKFSFRLNTRPNIRWACLNVAPVKPLWEKNPFPTCPEKLI